MTDDHRDFSFSTISSVDPTDIPLKTVDFESSLDSYSKLFDKAQHNFTASSEISYINRNSEESDKNPLSTVDHNRTFTKEKSRTLINAFTGKPISPNPWRKLCTKKIQEPVETDAVISIEIASKSPEIQQTTNNKSMENRMR